MAHLVAVLLQVSGATVASILKSAGFGLQGSLARRGGQPREWQTVAAYVSGNTGSVMQAVVRNYAVKAAIFAVAGLVGASMGAHGALAAGPFVGLQGSWQGSGMVTYASGTKERLACRVQYTSANEDRLTQALRCASDSYKFQINAAFVHANGSVSGHWDELSMDIKGTISGKATSGLISGKLHGPGFLASVVVKTDGSAQSVTISAEGQEIRSVAVEVRKR